MAAAQHQVFICYAHPDMRYADAICAALEISGIRCWMAPRDISPSRDWAEEIIDAITMAPIMVLVFSSHSNSSQQVRREVERAVSKNVPILPLRVENVVLSKSLEYFISTQQWLDAFPPPFEAHLDKLRDSVWAALSGAPAEDSPDPEPPPAGTPTKAVPPTTIKASPAISAQDLKYIEIQLAGYLGPVAKLLVSRAARNTSSPAELVALLANELELDAEKRAFQENCRFLES
jgi:hypothetical protein